MAGAGSQHHPQGVAGGAVAVAGAVSPTAAGPGEDSSDSEAEQEGPQKLIRKVSTSGQIRTKVRQGPGPAGELWVEGTLRDIPGTSIRRRGAGARPGWGVASLWGPDGVLGIPARGFKRYLGCIPERLASHQSKWLGAWLKPGCEFPPRKLKGSLVVHRPRCLRWKTCGKLYSASHRAFSPTASGLLLSVSFSGVLCPQAG